MGMGVEKERLDSTVAMYLFSAKCVGSKLYLCTDSSLHVIELDSVGK